MSACNFGKIFYWAMVKIGDVSWMITAAASETTAFQLRVVLSAILVPDLTLWAFCVLRRNGSAAVLVPLSRTEAERRTIIWIRVVTSLQVALHGNLILLFLNTEQFWHSASAFRRVTLAVLGFRCNFAALAFVRLSGRALEHRAAPSLNYKGAQGSGGGNNELHVVDNLCCPM